MGNKEINSEWVDPNIGQTSWIDPVSMEYHIKQWDDPKQSTKAFYDFFKRELANSKKVVDLGAGAGAATFFLASKFPSTKFVGVDQSSDLIIKAKETSKNFKLKNLDFDTGDWFDLGNKWGGVDGVISIQTLSWLPEIQTPMKQIFEMIKPNWIGLSSLFYEGDISARIEVFEHCKPRKTFYNVYSLKKLNRLANDYGYEVVTSDRFEIDIDVPKPKNKDIMGTFTEIVNGSLDYKRLQISGPLLLNWYFVLLKKIER